MEERNDKKVRFFFFFVFLFFFGAQKFLSLFSLSPSPSLSSYLPQHRVAEAVVVQVHGLRVQVHGGVPLCPEGGGQRGSSGVALVDVDSRPAHPHRPEAPHAHQRRDEPARRHLEPPGAVLVPGGRDREPVCDDDEAGGVRRPSRAWGGAVGGGSCGLGCRYKLCGCGGLRGSAGRRRRRRDGGCGSSSSSRGRDRAVIGRRLGRPRRRWRRRRRRRRKRRRRQRRRRGLRRRRDGDRRRGG